MEPFKTTDHQDAYQRVLDSIHEEYRQEKERLGAPGMNLRSLLYRDEDQWLDEYRLKPLSEMPRYLQHEQQVIQAIAKIRLEEGV